MNFPVPRTRVYITIDTECAEERNVGGRELPAQGYDVRVWGRFANQARESCRQRRRAALGCGGQATPAA